MPKTKRVKTAKRNPTAIRNDLRSALDAEMAASDRHDRSHSDTSLSAYAAASERTNVLYRELAAVAG
jgi:hypothetical protein